MRSGTPGLTDRQQVRIAEEVAAPSVVADDGEQRDHDQRSQCGAPLTYCSLRVICGCWRLARVDHRPAGGPDPPSSHLALASLKIRAPSSHLAKPRFVFAVFGCHAQRCSSLAPLRRVFLSCFRRTLLPRRLRRCRTDCTDRRKVRARWRLGEGCSPSPFERGRPGLPPEPCGYLKKEKGRPVRSGTPSPPRAN